MYDVIIVGAGCAGLTAAVYALRAGKTVLILEAETIGGQISSSPKVENFPSIKSISGAEFSSNLFDQATDLGADFELDRVTKVINGDVKKVITEYGEYECKALILATGVKHRKLDLENVDDYEGNGISYCAVCDGAFFKGMKLCSQRRCFLKSVKKYISFTAETPSEAKRHTLNALKKFRILSLFSIQL